MQLLQQPSRCSRHVLWNLGAPLNQTSHWSMNVTQLANVWITSWSLHSELVNKPRMLSDLQLRNQWHAPSEKQRFAESNRPSTECLFKGRAGHINWPLALAASMFRQSNINRAKDVVIERGSAPVVSNVKPIPHQSVLSSNATNRNHLNRDSASCALVFGFWSCFTTPATIH